MPNMPGGKLIQGFGGYVTKNGWMGTTQHFIEKIDVSEWILKQEYLNKRIALSGSCGAMTRHAVAGDWMAVLTLWYDCSQKEKLGIQIPKFGSNWGIVLQIGDPVLYPQVDPADIQVLTYAHNYRSPSGVITHVKTIDNSMGYDIVRQEVTIEGNSLMFYCISMQNENEYNVYVTTYKDRMRLPSD
jgi:hypothetical protein